MTVFFFFQAEDGIRDLTVTGVQTCALPISDVTGFGLLGHLRTLLEASGASAEVRAAAVPLLPRAREAAERSEEHTSELQSQSNLVCRLLLEKKKREPAERLPDGVHDGPATR